MPHQMPAVDKQLRAGFNVLKAYALWMTKTLIVIDRNATEIVKELAPTIEFTNALRDDGMSTFAECLQQSQESITVGLKKQQWFAHTLCGSLKTERSSDRIR